MTRYILGIDGGQTSTKCVLVDFDGHVLANGSGGGLIHLAAEGADERFVSAMREATAAAFTTAGAAAGPVAAIGLGLTGVEDGSPEAGRAAELMLRVIDAARVEVHSDAYTALLGAHGGQPGIIAIAGTGSHIMGMDATGRVARAGGWGWLLGDEGSALWIGRSGLNAALLAEDGVGAPTQLQSLMRQHFGIPALSEVKRLVYASTFGARGFAALAPVVSRAAADGDASAAGIIARAGQDLAAQVLAVQHRLNLAPDSPVSPVGGAYEHVHGLRQEFEAALQQRNSRARVTEPEYPPVLGAAMIALRLCGSTTRIES